MTHDIRPSVLERRSPDDPTGDEGRTSLMVVPPESVCRAADEYRRLYHPAACERLPPHVTVLYPYAPLEAWPELLPGLTAVAAVDQSFLVDRLWLGAAGPRGVWSLKQRLELTGRIIQIRWIAALNPVRDRTTCTR